MRKLNHALLFLGLGFLVYLVCKTGPDELWHQFGALGWGLLPLILSEGLANLAHTLGWRHCLRGPGLPLLRLFRFAMAGYAINYFTPSASVGGEVSKVALLGSFHPDARPLFQIPDPAEFDFPETLRTFQVIKPSVESLFQTLMNKVGAS